MSTLLTVVNDEPRTPPVGKIVPHPLHEDEQPAAKADEIHEMNEEPYQPGREAAQVDAPQVGYRRRSSDGCHRASISVAEGLATAFLLPHAQRLIAQGSDLGNEAIPDGWRLTLVRLRSQDA